MPRKKYDTYGIEQKIVSLTPELLITKEGMDFITKALNPPNTEALLDELESQAKAILTKHKLSDNWLEHADKNHTDFPDEQCIHAVEILKRLYRVKHWIAENNARLATYETIHMMNAVTDSVATYFEPNIYRGKKTLESASSGGIAKSSALMYKKNKWQEEADKLWVKFPKASIRDVASRIAKETDDSFETIRRNIKKSG